MFVANYEIKIREVTFIPASRSIKSWRFLSGISSPGRLPAPRHRDHLPGGPRDPQGGPQGPATAGLRGSDEVLQGEHTQDLP